MAIAGLNMMLKALGVDIDPGKLIADVEQMGKFLAQLHASQGRTEKMIAEMHKILLEAAPMMDDEEQTNANEKSDLRESLGRAEEPPTVPGRLPGSNGSGESGAVGG